jgi:hypothetical protein
VRQPIYGSSVARWKHYETQFPELFNALADHSLKRSQPAMASSSGGKP